MGIDGRRLVWNPEILSLSSRYRAILPLGPCSSGRTIRGIVTPATDVALDAAAVQEAVHRM